MTPSTTLLIFAVDSSEMAPLVAVIMKSPPVLLTLAATVCRKLKACFSLAPLNMGVRESMMMVTGLFLAEAMIAVI